MVSRYILYALTTICLLETVTNAADCDQPRKDGDPSGNDIATALTANNALAGVCSGEFPPNNDTSNTFNHWYMYYTVTRADASQPILYCTDAFNNIISQCITGGSYWGGRWSLNGFSYSISNSIYGQTPNNPLGPMDAGGPGNTGTNPSTGNPGSDSNPEGIDPNAGNPENGSNPGSNAPNGGGPVPGQTILTGVDPQGSTVVETLVPTTLSEYAGLTATTTISTTVTSNGTPFVIPWIIGPAGIAFAPINGDPFIPGITPPPVPPGSSGAPNDNSNDESDDDDQCQSAPLTGPPNGNMYEGLQMPITQAGPAAAAQTVIVNGAKCILPAGSTDPQCSPVDSGSGNGDGGSTSGSESPNAGNYPGCTVSVDGFTCESNCRGYVACGQWCADNCAYCMRADSVC